MVKKAFINSALRGQKIFQHEICPVRIFFSGWGKNFFSKRIVWNPSECKFLHVSAFFFLVAGGLFEEANSVEEIAFKYAVDHINRNRYNRAWSSRDCLTRLVRSF